MTIIPPEKLGVYLSEAEKYGVLPMFFLELSSGLRRGELLALRWDDLNVKDRILSVSKQVTRIDGELVVTEPKTKNSVRKVALSQQAVDLLVQEHEQHPDSPILFPSPRTGGYWSPDAVSRINRKLLAEAGIEEHIRFHEVRHISSLDLSEHPLIFRALCVRAAKTPITKELWILEPVFRCIRGKLIHLVFCCETVHLCKVGKAAIKRRGLV